MKFESLHPRCRFEEIPTEHLSDLGRVHLVCNELESAMDRFFTVTSGYRTWEDHKRIYREINDRRLIQRKPELPIPLKSRHLFGQAVDLSDPDGTIKLWLREHVDTFMEDFDIYCEMEVSTPGWCHLQIVPPRSGRRWFYP